MPFSMSSTSYCSLYDATEMVLVRYSPRVTIAAVAAIETSSN